MSWIQLDDGILDHPKFVLAVRLGGSEAIHLWLGLRAYCAKHLSDGMIPEHMISDVRGPSDPDRRTQAVAALVTAGLVYKSETCLTLHDFLQWSKSRDRIMKERKALKARVDRHRAGNGHVTRYKDVGNGLVRVPDPIRSDPIIRSRDPISPQKVNASGSEVSSDTPSAPAAVALTRYEFPVNGKGAKVWHLPQPDHEAMVTAFPGVDAVAEYRKAFAWLRANPRRRKTPAGMSKFLYAWLEREQNKGRTALPSGQRPAPQLPDVKGLSR